MRYIYLKRHILEHIVRGGAEKTILLGKKQGVPTNLTFNGDFILFCSVIHYLPDRGDCLELNGCSVTQPRITRLFLALSLSEQMDVVHVLHNYF